MHVEIRASTAHHYVPNANAAAATGVLYVDSHLDECVKISGYVIHGAEVKIPWPLNAPSCFKGEEE